MILTGAVDAAAAANKRANEQAEAEVELAVEMQLHPPSTAIAKEMHKINLVEQHSNATHLFAFFADDVKEIAQLNALGNNPAACIVNIPKLDQIRVHCSLGFRMSPIGRVLPVANQILAMTGEGDVANSPAVMTFPKEMVTFFDWAGPSNTEFDAKALNPDNSRVYTMFKHANLTHHFLIIKIMPIPSFLVYDGFETDLDTITVYNHVRALDNQEEPNIVALSAFLQRCMTSRNQRDSNTYSASQVFVASFPPAARVWGVQKLLTSFPAFNTTNEGNEMPVPGPNTEPNAALMAELLKLLNPQSSSTITIPSAEESTMEDKFGMSRSKLDIVHLWQMQKCKL